MNTGENAEALKKIIDFIRKVSIVILCLHFYVYCYAAFGQWGLTHHAVERVLVNIGNMGLFSHFYVSKVAALLLLLISLIGSRGRKDEKLKTARALRHFITGIAIYGLSYLLLKLDASVEVLAALYMSATSIGYLLTLYGGSLLSRIIRNRLDTDIFNKLQETFPQEERLLENEYSINLPAQYNLKGKIKDSWINIINGFRGLLVSGTPGSRCGGEEEPEKATLSSGMSSRNTYQRDSACSFMTSSSPTCPSSRTTTFLNTGTVTR